MKGTAADADAAELYPVPDEVLLNAKVGAVVERVTSFEYKPHHKSVQSGRNKVGDKGEIRRWRWSFNLTDDEFAGLTVYGETEPKIAVVEGDKAKEWYETIMDTQISVGDDFDTDLLTGLPCCVTVRHDEPRKSNDGRLFYDCPVDEVFPAGSKTGANVDTEPPF